MSTHTYEGIVLQRSRHLEFDVRLKLFLRSEGKILAVLKGGQKSSSKLKGLQEPFSRADYHLFLPSQRINGRILGGRLISSHTHIRLNMPAFMVASQACEMIDLLHPYRAPSPDEYDILAQTLTRLKSPHPPVLEWLWFTLQILQSLGHGDCYPDILKLTLPDDREPLGSWLKQPAETGDHPSISDLSLRRAMAVVEGRLETILPRRLKSDVLKDVLV